MPKRTSSAKNSINCRVNSFRRVCAMACVNDGYIGDDEIDELDGVSRKINDNEK